MSQRTGHHRGAGSQRDGEGILRGVGTLHRGPRVIATVSYKIRINPANGQASVVEFERQPPANDGELVHLTLEDGRVVNCQILDESPYCAVVGDAPVLERRHKIRTKR